MERSVELAKKDLHRCFPNGLEGNEHSLLCIEAQLNGQSCLVGNLWHSINTEDNSTIIYDFYVSNLYRGAGYGKQALSLLEQQLKAHGIEQIKLRVV